MTRKAFLLDIDFVNHNGAAALRLFMQTPEGKSFRLYDSKFEPYFLVLPDKRKDPEKVREGLEKLRTVHRGNTIGVKRVEQIEKISLFQPIKIFKVVVHHPHHVVSLREEAKQYGETFEHAIAWVKRWLVDTQVTPTALVEIEHDGLELESIKNIDNVTAPKLRALAFDIEVHNPAGVPTPDKDAAIMISYADEKDSHVLSYGKKFSHEFVTVARDEKEMLEKFCDLLRKKHVDMICTYNGDSFDLPYLQARALKLKADFQPGRDRKKLFARQAGIRKITRVGGRIHFDVFNSVSFLNTVGAIRLPRLTLDRAYRELLGKEKEDVTKLDIHKIWDKGTQAQLDHLANYCRSDSQSTLELAQHLLPQQIELSRTSGETLFDASRATAGQLVEMLLMRAAFKRNEIIPNKPKGDVIEARLDAPIEGAFVKTPIPGVYNNLAMLDFKSLYPSIIVAHNVDPTTLNCEHCKHDHDCNVSPQGHKFCKKDTGLIPATVRDVLRTRFAVQAEMRKLEKDIPEHRQLHARQWALKIIANSFYGYLGYARSRWYSRECAESVTAWARQYIQDTIKQAQNEGFNVIYADTDSLLIEIKPGEQGEKDVMAFRAKINKKLPEGMELELEDFYPRGIFVSKKQDATGAKKKYALINKQGKIKIRGFELVRRDWSRVARHTQRKVLEILLREGDRDKAVQVVRDVVEKLREGTIPLEDLVIYTQLRKSVKSYEGTSPELSAFLKARKEGINLPEGAVISYVITKSGKTISEKAQLFELAKDYDPNYYIEHQVIPGVLKILGEMGITKDTLLGKGKQKSLGEW
ncbi:MAG TPA: DNA-directed DNA polymerase [Candidatus Norongarragalinales archaeon]|jgi:DNA polymerase elongation subunit (family B)|nr:DNA-directed DNA polymerase [Candidatus Norongarragalinales archaeon]